MWLPGIDESKMSFRKKEEKDNEEIRILRKVSEMSQSEEAFERVPPFKGP